MQIAIPSSGTISPLVQLELSPRQTPAGPRIQLSEQPRMGELALAVDADEAQLFAPGELLVADRPLRVRAVVHLDELTLLWLDNRRWLLLPVPGDERPAAQRLADRLSAATIREYGCCLWLSPAWLGDLPDNFQLWQCAAGALPRNDGKSHPVIVPDGGERYQLLIRRAGAELLRQWLPSH
ncbi:MAG: hypothetical protein HWE39_03150 [Oceanospirillaceae bacterium]|nr:hypothetical protein [Oceanospirillaceae bacterium]